MPFNAPQSPQRTQRYFLNLCVLCGLCGSIKLKSTFISLVFSAVLCHFQPSFAFPFGKDADLASFKMEPEECTAPPSHGNIGVALSRALIRFHHNVVTPIDGPRSHYRPSSSQYTLDAIEKYGFIQGWILGCDRLMRENDDPWIYPTMIDEHGDRYKSDPVR